MFNNVKYKAINGNEYIINGDPSDIINDLSHKVLFSIQKVNSNLTFSYNISISNNLWEYCWKIAPNSESQLIKVKEIYLEKAKRLLDSDIDEYTEITLTPVNTPDNLNEAVSRLKQSN